MYTNLLTDLIWNVLSNFAFWFREKIEFCRIGRKHSLISAKLTIHIYFFLTQAVRIYEYYVKILIKINQ